MLEKVLQIFQAFCLSVILILYCSASGAAEIKQIKIDGLQRINEDTVLLYSKTAVGYQYNAESGDRIIKSLFGTGFFEDVKISFDNMVLRISLKENPLINEILFEGNQGVKTEDLKEMIKSKEYGLYSPQQLQEDVRNIRSLYHKKGWAAVQITPQKIPLANQRINLIFSIHEQEKSYIRSIDFIGNDHISDSTLSSAIFSRAKSWYRPFSVVDIYDPERLAIDKELIRQFYMENGFADCIVGSVVPEFLDEKDFQVTFNIHEGSKYKYQGFNINVDTAVSGVSISELSHYVKIKPGAIFNIRDLELSAEALTQKLGDLGYAFADVDYLLERDTVNSLITVKFIVQSTYKIYIRNINIKNNTRTLDKVIRREFRVAEGDGYSNHLVARSKQRIQKLGFFKSVEVQNIPTDAPDQIDMKVTVEEAPTAQVNFGLAYNTLDGPVGMVAFSDANFLGTGRKIDLGASKASRAKDLSFGFFEPYFLDRNIGFGLDIYHRAKDRQKEVSASFLTRGISLSFNFELLEKWRYNIAYHFKDEDIRSVSSSASLIIKAQSGHDKISGLHHEISYDDLDDNLDPRNGIIARAVQMIAGLGGQVHFTSNRLESAYYTSFYKNALTLKIAGSATKILSWKHDKLRVSDRIFLGKDDIRGFENIGPIDATTFDYLGGDVAFTAGAELLFPMGAPKDYKVRAVAFLDSGLLSGTNIRFGELAVIANTASKIRLSSGVGIVWDAAIGRVRIDYAIPIHRNRYDKLSQFRINIGYSVY